MQTQFLKTISLVIFLCLTISCAAQSSSQTLINKTETQILKKEDMPTRSEVDDIVAIMVMLEVADKNSLFVLLADDGSINRLGTGAEDNKENNMHIGITSREVFEKFRKQIEPDVFKWEGEYKSPNIAGKTCKLTVGFKLANGTEIGSVWTYGAQSQGPPPEIKRFVVSAVEATEPWYEEQKRITKKP